MRKILTLLLAMIVCFSCMCVDFNGIETKAYTAHTVDEAIAYLHTLVGKKVGSGQCVALVVDYYQYLGVERPYGNGEDYATNTLPTGWQRIKGAQPQKGDIMIWTGTTYGHVAICGGDSVYFHQNWDGLYVSIKNKSYTNGYNIISTGEHANYWGVIRPDFKANTTPISYENITPDHYFIRNKAGGYLNIAYGKDENETAIHNHEFGNYDSQVYDIYKESSGYALRPLCAKTRVVNTYCTTEVSGKTVNLYDKTGDDSQVWKFQPVGDGYVIRNAQNPQVCMTPYNYAMIVSEYTGADNQIWYLEKACTVKYDANGGSGAPDSQRVRAGYKTVLSAQKPTRNGYTFLGWSTAKNDTTASWDEKSAVTIYGDTTLYAVWKSNACSHKYSGNCDSSCNVCGATRTAPHSYKSVVTKATTSKNGKITKTCSGCKKKVTSTIYYAKSFSLSKTSFTYNGKVQTPTVTVKDAKGKVIDPKYYTLSYSSGRKNVGTYKVTIKLKGNYSGSKTLSYKINPISISKCKVSISGTSYTYNGKVIKPSVKVLSAGGSTLKNGTHYTVTYSKGCKAPGTYKVTVKMKGTYSGSKTFTYKINPISISKCKVSISGTSYYYDGKTKTPSVKVLSAGGSTLKNGTHYTVSYSSGRKNVGTYKVTVKMKGTYSGSKTFTFKIIPPKTSISKITADINTMKVYIAKKSTQVTGYEIQYATAVDFTDALTKTITSYKTTSATLSELDQQTTYYVRVRTYKTVSGVKYYSGWSTVKVITTKRAPIVEQ